MGHQQAGRLDAAEEAYRELLDKVPERADVWHLLGVLAHQRGEHAVAVERIGRAIALRPDQPLYHSNQGLMHSALGQAELATASYRRAIELDPDFAQAHYHLGVLALGAGDDATAAAHFRDAVERRPGLSEGWYNLGLACKRQDLAHEALEAFQRALDIDPGYVQALQNLGNTLHGLQRDDEAREAYERLVELEPSSGVAQHMVAALDGARTDRCPPAFVTTLFDGYAAEFESVLVGALSYAAPAELRALLPEAAGPEPHVRHAIDLGCGTGLMGRQIRSLCRRLSGVDLSTKMVEQARAAGVYDTLVVGDLCDFLRETEPGFDLVVAADALNYLGDLDPCFAAVAAGAAPGARFVLSLERGLDGDYHLTRSGRYVHHEAYVRRLAEQHRLTVRALRTTTLRQERGEPVEGMLLLLEAPR